MSDFVSRSALLEAMPKNDEIFSFEVRRVICNVPTIDAVEVIRCKECRFWGMAEPIETENCKFCKLASYMVGENGYCAYGERKMDGDENA